jgi:hypothetical protein
MPTGKPFPIETIDQLLWSVRAGMTKVEAHSNGFSIKVYTVNSNPKYAFPSLRVDIQDLEPRDFS